MNERNGRINQPTDEAEYADHELKNLWSDDFMGAFLCLTREATFIVCAEVRYFTILFPKSSQENKSWLQCFWIRMHGLRENRNFIRIKFASGISGVSISQVGMMLSIWGLVT